MKSSLPIGFPLIRIRSLTSTRWGELQSNKHNTDQNKLERVRPRAHTRSYSIQVFNSIRLFIMHNAKLHFLHNFKGDCLKIKIFAPSDSRLSNSFISAKYCPSLFIQLSDEVYIPIKKIDEKDSYDGFCGLGSHLWSLYCENNKSKHLVGWWLKTFAQYWKFICYFYHL